MDQKDQLHPGNINTVNTRKFSNMSGAEKVKHIGKVIAFILTFGFAYPTLFSD